MSSIYFNPRVDYAFKRLLGSTENKDLLIDFLNAMVYYGEDQIKNVEITNPYVPGEAYTQKGTYVDVRAKLDDDSEILIEMQMMNVVNFPQRVLYNTAKAYSGQLQRGEEYKRLQKVISITITNFALFAQQPKWYSRFSLREVISGMPYPGDNNIELVFVELPKFDVGQVNFANKAHRWALFLKEGEMLNQKLQTYLMQDPVIQQAYKNLEIARMNNAERYELEGRETWLRDQLGAMEYALTEGFTNGLTKGLSEGRTEGRSEGVAQITLRQLTRRLGELPTPVQTQISALKLPQLEQLADALLDFVSLTDLQVWLDHANEKDPAQNFTGL